MTAAKLKRPSRHAEERQITGDPALRSLVGVMETLREKHREMPLQLAHILFLVASRPGISPGELAGAVGVSQSATSRNLQALGDGSSTGIVGMKLIEARTDPRDFRARVLYLTAEGRAYVLRLLGNLHDGKRTADACGAQAAHGSDKPGASMPLGG